jgi:hypothetical protein
LSVANCDGGGVTVTATTIDWLQPTGGGSGCIQTGATTNVTYTGGGPLLGGVQGTILDLPPVPVADFMTFVGHPILDFDLSAIGPGVNNLVCAAVLDPNLPACSPFAGSPFILAPNATGTSVTLTATGTATDASVDVSTWFGAFTTQLAGLTPAQVQALVGTPQNPGQAITSTHSGEFRVTFNVIPEPGTYAMMLGGGLLMAVAAFRRKKA